MRNYFQIFTALLTNLLLLTSAATAVDVESDNANDIVLDADTTYTVAESGDYTFSGIISGDYAITRDGLGALTFTGNNTYSGGTTISAGTLKVTPTMTGASSAHTALGSGTVTIGTNGTLVWKPTTSSTGTTDCDLTNTITGTGTLRLEVSSRGNTTFALDSKLSDFTGTLQLAGNTRIEWKIANVTNLNKVSTIEIENGSEFWTSGSSGGNTYASNFLLNGYGVGAGGDSAQRGVFRINTSSNFSGTMTLASDSLLGMAGNYTANFYNDFNLQNHTLYVANTCTAGGTLTISGDVSEGDIRNRSYMYATVNEGTSSVTLRFATAADAAYAKNQTISANIQQNSSTAIVFEPAAERTINANGVISGSGAVMKKGAGTLVIGACDTFSGGLTIENGIVTLKDDAVGTSTTVTTRTYQAGTGTINIGENGTFIWYNQYNTDTIPNTITGAGKFILNAEHSKSANYGGNYGISTNFTGFTGTLELKGHARANLNTLGGTSNVIVNSGNMVWFTGGTHAANFTISGEGAGAGGDGGSRGAIAGSGTSTINGTITLAADAYIGLRDSNPTMNLNGNIETNGHSLRFGQNYNSGGKYNLKSNVSSTGETLGTLNFANVSSSAAYSANIGDSSAAAAAVTQLIAANLNYSNTTGTLTFTTGENRTIEIQGQFTGTGGVTIEKNGAGTLKFDDSAPVTGTMTVNAGTVIFAPTTYNAASTTNAGYKTGLTSLTVNGGATVDLNTSNAALTALNVVSGTVNANYQFRNISGKLPCIGEAADITVGSAAGDTALLNIGFKGCGDHAGKVKIYDGGTICMKGADVSFAGSNTITFVGGGAITSTSGAYFNFRGDGKQALIVEGENANASISSSIMMYNQGLGSVNVVESSSSLTFSSSATQGYHDAKLGFRKFGKGTFVLTSGNQFQTLQINEGTVEFRGNGNLTPYKKGDITYGVNVSVADGAKLVIKNGTNFTSSDTPSAEYPATFTFHDGATLIIDSANWTLTPLIEDALTTGTLGGSGTIAGTIDTDGLTISPGNGTGDLQTLTVNGNLTLGTSSNLYFEVGSTAAQHDTLKVTGTVDLSDGTLTLVKASETSEIQIGDVVTLLEIGDVTDFKLEDLNFVTNYTLPYADGRWGLALNGNNLVAFVGDAASLPEPSAWILLLLGIPLLIYRHK